MFAKALARPKVSMKINGSPREAGMKRLLALLIVWTLLVVTGTLVSADGHTRHHKSQFGGTGSGPRGRAGS